MKKTWTTHTEMERMNGHGSGYFEEK